MDKLVTFLGEDTSGELTIRSLFSGGGHTKTADAAPRTLTQKVAEYIGKIKPTAGKLYVLVNALGAGEYYGSNINADYFGERMLKGVADRFEGIDVHGPECRCDDIYPEDGKFGFTTFYEAGIYRHHRNKDVTKSYGRVLFADYNDRMHRVELIIEIDRAKATELGHEDVVDALDEGRLLAVSMGCFPAGTPITLGSGEEIPIESIEVGDWVRTHTGSVRRVTELHPRLHTGDMYTIECAAGTKVTCTSEHPLFVFPNSSVKLKCGVRTRPVEEITSESAGWVAAKDVSVGDYLAIPVDSTVETPAYANRALARLLGYYLAEGYLVRGHNGPNARSQYIGIELTVNKEDAYLTEIEDLCREWGTLNLPVVRDRRNSLAAKSVFIADFRLAELCAEHCGAYSRTKRLSLSLMHWDLELQREMLGAYINGDGTFCRGTVYMSTASGTLSKQLVDLLLRHGIPASISSVKHAEGTGYNATTTYEWQVRAARSSSNYFAQYSSKVQSVPVQGRGGERVLTKDYYLTPIKQVTHEKHHGVVYNFEVDGDESYVASGIAAHNCRVKYDVCSLCGNKAKDVASYCTHMQMLRNKIMPSGQKVFVHNPWPKFFDLSFVVVGADRISYAMMKVASADPDMSAFAGLSAEQALEAGMHGGDAVGRLRLGLQERAKIAELEKRIPAMAARLSPAMSAMDETMPLGMLSRLAQHPLKDVLSTTAAAGMVMKPLEYQTIIIIKSGNPLLAGNMYRNNQVFSPTGGMGHAPSMGPEGFSTVVRDILGAIMRRRSGLSGILEQRAGSVKQASAQPAFVKNNAMLEAISNSYNSYRFELLEKVANIAEVALKRDDALLGMLYGDDVDSLLTSRPKTAAVSSGTLVAAMPLAFLLGAHVSDNGNGGGSSSIVKFVREHPVLATSILTGLARMGALLNQNVALQGKIESAVRKAL